jgi:hypothetical protein
MKSLRRHDLIPSSCDDDKVFNRQDEKKMKICNNVKMLETDLDRKYFTRHGQHLNLSGKELISMKLSMVIKEIFLLIKNYPLFVCNGKILSLKDSKVVH